MQNKIYVGNLAPTIDESRLKRHFQPYGNIQTVEIIYDRETSRSRGFGFITYESEAQAQASLEANGQDLEAQPLRVSLAQARQPA